MRLLYSEASTMDEIYEKFNEARLAKEIQEQPAGNLFLTDTKSQSLAKLQKSAVEWSILCFQPLSLCARRKAFSLKVIAVRSDINKKYCSEDMQKAPNLLELIKEAEIEFIIKKEETQNDEICEVLDGGKMRASNSCAFCPNTSHIRHFTKNHPSIHLRGWVPKIHPKVQITNDMGYPQEP